jgi:putative DNA primase/helicase
MDWSHSTRQPSLDGSSPITKTHSSTFLETKMGFDRKLSTDEIAAAVERAFARQEGREPRLATGTDNAVIGELASLDPLEYELGRDLAAAGLGIRVSALDKLVKGRRAARQAENAVLPHWNVEPSAESVDGAALLNNLRQIFRRHVVLPTGADIVLSLWVLHAWTMDAGDISPLMVLVSPTKRCGKTSVLILIYFLTPRSELSSNITAPALFRYIEDVRPTLLIDEADSFAKDNEELRGILNSGHTKAAANVIRNVDHKPRRFSTWAPKAIATIGTLADTLEDRAVVLRLQRKPPGATVERLGRRDNADFAALRSQAARWAADNFDKLADPDPKMPNLNDRAADNWRPLLAIADLAGGTWPEEARRAACLLSGEQQDGAIGVELLRDIRSTFGDDDVIRSSDLVAKLTADAERPWAEWKHGRPLTQKQLAGLLAPFHIISLTVHPPGLPDGKGYRRIDFEEAWAAYCPVQNTSPQQSLRFRNIQTSQCR